MFFKYDIYELCNEDKTLFCENCGKRIEYDEYDTTDYYYDRDKGIVICDYCIDEYIDLKKMINYVKFINGKSNIDYKLNFIEATGLDLIFDIVDMLVTDKLKGVDKLTTALKEYVCDDVADYLDWVFSNDNE